MIGSNDLYERRRAGARGRAGAGSRVAADFIGELTAGMTHQKRLDQVRWIARMMDDQFVVPGTNFRFGWDSIIGLFPGLGDAVTSRHLASHRASRLADRRLTADARAHARQYRHRFPGGLGAFDG